MLCLPSAFDYGLASDTFPALSVESQQVESQRHVNMLTDEHADVASQHCFTE